MSAVTPFQPTLPPEGDFTDAEIDFMESSPPGMFPENQNSNFGLFRKLFTDFIQELITQEDSLYNENFVETSKDYLDEWERMEGLPPNPSGLDIATRQAMVLSRVRQGPFTRTGRRSIVENYIQATFGTPTLFSPTGVALSASGLPLYADVGNMAQAYEIVEDIPNFLYHVYISNVVTVAAGMARELTRITPAGISYDITSVANPVPTLYWKLNDPVGTTAVDDHSTFNRAGTVSGITFGGYAAPGVDLNPSALFANAGSYVRATSYAPFVVNSQRTFMGWGWRLATTDIDTLFMDQSTTGPQLYLGSAVQDVLFRTISGNAQTWTAAWPGLAQWVHWALTYNDSTKIAELFINGVSKGTKTLSAAYAGTSTNFQLSAGASANSWNGYQRDVAVYERILSPAEILSYAHGFQLP